MQPCSLMLVSSPSAASAACLPARMRPHGEFGSSPSPLGCPVSGWAFCNAQLTVNSSLQKQNQCRLTSLWRTWQYRMLIEMKFVITHLNNKLVVFARAVMSTVFLFLSVGKLVRLQHNEWDVGIFSVSPSLTHTHIHTLIPWVCFHHSETRFFHSLHVWPRLLLISCSCILMLTSTKHFFFQSPLAAIYHLFPPLSGPLSPHFSISCTHTMTASDTTVVNSN